MASSRTDVTIRVTPVMQHKREVICDIQPDQGAKKGEKIRLGSGNYTLKFELQPGTPSGIAFKTDDIHGNCRAIYFDEGGCPGNHNGTIPAGQLYEPKRIDDKTLKVQADVSGNPYAIHYRLNFNDNRYCDPIIIHD